MSLDGRGNMACGARCAPKCSADLTYHGVSGAEDVKCHPGGPEKQMLDLGVACADLSGGATDDCAGACRASWDANYTKCLEPFWQFIPAPFRPPFDRVKETCLVATAQAAAGAPLRSLAALHARAHSLERPSSPPPPGSLSPAYAAYHPPPSPLSHSTCLRLTTSACDERTPTNRAFPQIRQARPLRT